MQPADQMLHEQQEWHRVTLSSIGDAVITTDTAGKITFLNPVAEELTGWPLADAVGTPLETVFRIINEETREAVECPATKALRDGLVVGLANQSLLISRDSSERPIDDTAAPIRDLQGRIRGVVLIFRDVTQRRRQEKKLRESEERFRLLVECVKDYAIFMLDPRGFIASWNEGAERIKGYTADEIIGKHFSCFYPPQVVAEGFPDRELEVASQVGRFEDEGWRIRKDGSRFWANVVITAVRDETGTLRGFAKVTRDLTERRNLEKARVQSEALSELNRRKDEFLAMLSHELRNPLAPITSAVELLRLDEQEAARHPAMSILERQVAHLTRLVDDLLEVSRISTGRIRLQPELIDLRPVVERAVEAVRASSSQRNHDVSIALPDEPVWLHADPVRIEQVIVNLLTNAVKYTNAGGQIRVSVEQNERDAVLRVADNGVGIAPELLPNVFDLFTQAERSLDRSQGGLGVGLTVVRRIVNMHGGNVEAFSEGPGRGSEFVVRLPVSHPTDNRPVDDTAGEQQPQSGALRVLIVDDNKDSTRCIAMLLRTMGYEVKTAYSGAEALAAAGEFRPDVAFLDIGMPDMNGYELARRFRADARLQSTRLAALTGYGRESDQQQSHEAGFDLHLVKPVEPKIIGEFLARVR